MEIKINNETKTKAEINNYKELLISLIKKKLDNRLSKLERRNKMHLTLMNVTTQTVKDITLWAINTNKQIIEKDKKNKQNINTNQKAMNKNKKIEKIETRANTRKQSFRSKTPLRNKQTKSFIKEESKALTLNRNYSKSKKFFTLNPKSEKIDTKVISNSFIIKKKKRKSINNNVKLETEVLRRPSVISNKSNKTSAPKRSKNIETPTRKKTPFKKRYINDKTEKSNISIKINDNKSNENVIHSKIIKKAKKEKDEITEMETALQKGEFLTNDDPLLISPITDSDFFNNKQMSNSNISTTSNLDIKEKINSLFHCLDEKIFEKICVFLNITDMIQLKNSSKHFHKLFIVYIENFLDKEKIYFNKKLLNLNIVETIPKKLTLNDFTISEKSLKAIKLLNEPNISRFFLEKTELDDNKLIIYRLFFQLIKHPIKNIEKNKKEEFWEKCKYYFSHEGNGKAGDLIKKILDEKKIVLDGNNLYKIYKLAIKDLDKIYPQYFSTFCGATGLITFFIKDILDFVGISNDEKMKLNSYWTYINIIEDLNNKINHIKNWKLN